MSETGSDLTPHDARSWASVFSHFRYWGALVLVVIAIGVAWISGSRLSAGDEQAQPKTGAQVGLLAPDFSLPALDGALVSLSAQRGNVVLVNLWASWCGPCRSEMPAVNRVYQAHRASGFVVLAVNAANQDDESEARAFVRNLGLVFPILFDRDGSAGRAYRLRSLPTSYFIGRDGVIREIVVGSMSEAMLEARVKRLLAGGQ
jgi:cytochrome c biogenesis protein CcmG/thiol:disulfide interchange protein DsbE